jgi:hypothetical protein
MNWCILILAVGNIFYKESALDVFSHYFNKNKINYHVIDKMPENIDFRNSHPSWWKLLCHKILPGYDFILCWDLDLLPDHPNVDIIKYINFNKINMAWDSHAKHFPNDKYKPSFKYNGGLIGIPKSLSVFTEGVFYKHSPGYYPSYEQYYLNDEIEEQNIDIHEFPENINVLFSIPMGIAFFAIWFTDLLWF